MVLFLVGCVRRGRPITGMNAPHTSIARTAPEHREPSPSPDLRGTAATFHIPPAVTPPARETGENVDESIIRPMFTGPLCRSYVAEEKQPLKFDTEPYKKITETMSERLSEDEYDAVTFPRK